MKWDDVVKWASGVIGGVLGAVGSVWGGLQTCLLIFNGVDYVSGVICALCGCSSKTDGGRLSSTAGFVGIARKMFVWVVVLVATAVDHYVFRTGSSCQTAVTLYYIANEALSILENCALMKMPIPSFLRNLLEVLREKSDKGSADADAGAQDVKVQQDPQRDADALDDGERWLAEEIRRVINDD